MAVLSLRWVAPLASGLLLLVVCGTGLWVLRERLAARVYEGRLRALAEEYGELRERYNEAVMRTAVTELYVRGEQLSVRIRTAAGIIRTIPVPCDPSREIYVDYVVCDGRLWIRRVFDSGTPPEKATVIDPAWAHLDWSNRELAYGKAVYRQLAEGAWVVTVTGNGSLGLVPATAPEGDTELVAAPDVKDFRKAVESAREEAAEVGLIEVVKHLFGGGNG